MRVFSKNIFRLYARISTLAIGLFLLSGCELGFVSFERQNAFGEIPSQLRINTSETFATGECHEIRVELLGESGEKSRSRQQFFAQILIRSMVDATNITVAYSDSACSVRANSIEFPAGDSSIKFYVMHTKAEKIRLRVLGDGLSEGELNLEALPGRPNFSVINGATTLAAGQCSRYTVTLLDDQGNVAPVEQTETVNVELTKAAVLYSDSFCSQRNTSGQVNLEIGSQGAIFYVKDSVAELISISATSSGYGGASKSILIEPGPAQRLQVLPESQIKNLTAGQCLGPIVVTPTDAYSNPAFVDSASIVSLEGINTLGRFYSSLSNCNSDIGAVSEMSISPSQSSINFYFRNTRSEGVVITARVPNLDDGSYVLEVDPDAPTVFSIAGVQSKIAGECREYELTVRDQFLNTSPVSNPLSANLSELANKEGLFYRLPGCAVSDQTTSVTIPNGESKVKFYYRATVAQSKDLRARRSGFNEGQLPVNVNPDIPVALFLDKNITVAEAGDCVPATIFSRDQFGNNSRLTNALGVQLSNINRDSTLAGLGSFYASLSTCNSQTSAITQRTIAANSDNSDIYFRDNKVEDVRLNLSAAGNVLTPTFGNVDIGPAAPFRIALNGPQVLTAGVCSSSYTVALFDQFNNPSPARSNLALNANLNVTPGLVSYHGTRNSGDSCDSSPFANGNFSFPDGALSRSIFLRAVEASSGKTLTVSGAGLQAGTVTNITINPGAPAQIIIENPLPPKVLRNMCQAYTMTLKDAFGNVTPALVGGFSVGLSSNGAGVTFYGDAGCGTPSASAVFGQGNSTKQFSFRSSVVQLLQIDANPPVGATRTVSILVWEPGALDPTFSADGKSRLNVFTRPFVATSGTSDGNQVVVAGYTDDGVDRLFAVARFDQNGNGNGTVEFECGNSPGGQNKDSRAFGIAQVSSGRFLVVGYQVAANGLHNSCVALLNSNLSLRQEAVIAADSNAHDELRAVAVTSTGTTSVVAGFMDIASERDMYARRIDIVGGALLLQGDLVSVDFTADLDVLSNDVAFAVSIDSNARAFVAGSSDDTLGKMNMAVFRVDFSGTGLNFNNSFGAKQIDFGPNSVAVSSAVRTQGTNYVFLAGATQFPGGSNTAVASFDINGNNQLLSVQDFGTNESIQSLFVENYDIYYAGEIDGNFSVGRLARGGSIVWEPFVTADLGAYDVGYGISVGADTVYVGGRSGSLVGLARYFR